jgi:hypothetical protein
VIAPSVETIGLPDALATLLSGRRGEQQGA